MGDWKLFDYLSLLVVLVGFASFFFVDRTEEEIGQTLILIWISVNYLHLRGLDV